VASNQHDRLQSVMNAAARLVCSARKCDHITPLIRDLHWLRMPQRIEFKLAVLAFRCLHGMSPPYLARELRRVADMDSRRRLRSASTFELNIPPTRRVTVGDRSIDPFVHNRYGPKIGAVPVWEAGHGSLSNTMWPGPRLTCMPSFILIRPTAWPQYSNVTDRQERQTDKGPIA